MIGTLNVTPARLEEFARERGFQTFGSAAVDAFHGIEPIDAAGANDVTFCRFDDERGANWLRRISAGAVFVLPHVAEQAFAWRPAFCIACEIPRMALAEFLIQFWQAPSSPR